MSPLGGERREAARCDGGGERGGQVSGVIQRLGPVTLVVEVSGR